jgi:transcription antitermination factor NusG
MMAWFCLSSFDPVTSADLLRQAGYVAYCPQERVTKRRGRREPVDIARAIWPGYMFVCCEPDRLGAALVIGDCMDFLRYTDASGSRGPLRMREGVLIPIILAEMFGALDFTDKTPASYKPAKGDRVRITAGVFRDYLARVTSVSKNTAKLTVEKGGRMTAKIRELEAA